VNAKAGVSLLSVARALPGNECNKSSTWDRRVRLWTQSVILISVTRALPGLTCAWTRSVSNNECNKSATWVDVCVDAKCV
jgi:hypothetical protein